LYSHHKFVEYPGAGPPRVSFMVCALPRSGSSLLCELLAATGLAGVPTEFFEPNQRPEFARRWGTEGPDDYLREMLAHKTTPNGVFGLKVLYPQLVDVLGDTSPARVFPNLRYVYVTRHDHLRQAVSFARAIQTDQWASDQPAGTTEPVFDADQIDELLAWIRREEVQWEALFERERVQPLRIAYEDFVAAMDRTLRDVLRFLDVELPAGFQAPVPALGRQADERSEEWVRRYRSRDSSSTPGA
jgi:trehalose 2-sulfotransferase